MTKYQVRFRKIQGKEEISILPNLDNYPEDASIVISKAREQLPQDTEYDSAIAEVVHDFNPELEDLFRLENDIFNRLNGVN